MGTAGLFSAQCWKGLLTDELTTLSLLSHSQIVLSAEKKKFA